MEKRSDRFDTSLRALAAEERQRLESHPAAEELAAYHAGELSGEAAERLQDHLALCPECTRLLLDLARFEDGELGEEAADGPGRLTREELAEDLTAIRGRLRDEAQAQGRVLTFEPRPEGPEPVVRRVVPGWYHALAAALAMAAVGLGLWGMRLDRTADRWREPQVVTDAADLVPERGGVSRGADTGVVISSSGPHYVLRLGLAEVRTFAEYRVVVRDAEDRLVWQEDVARLSELGDLWLVVPRAFLAPGRYEIRLFGDEEELAVYAVRVAAEA